MADTPQFQTARHVASASDTVLDRPGLVAVKYAGARTRFAYRGPASVVTEAFGVPGESAPCRAHSTRQRASLWLGPDERLLIAPDGEATGIAAAFAQLAVAQAHSLVDVSHRNVGMLITGLKVTQLLSAACPLDVDASALPVDMCTRTIFGKAEIILWRTAADTFHVEVWRSFVPYVTDLMREAARDL